MWKGLKVLMGVGIVALFFLLNQDVINDSVRQVEEIYDGKLDTLAMVQASARGSSAQLESPRIGKTPYRIEEVVDGDTYDVVKEGAPGAEPIRVRLIGVDTPEKYDGDKLAEQARRWNVPERTVRGWGRRASAFADSLAEGQRVFIEHGEGSEGRGHKGRYGRVLAYLWVAGKDGTPKFMLNEELLKAGHATATDYDDYRYRKRFTSIEEFLRGHGTYPWYQGPKEGASGQRMPPRPTN